LYTQSRETREREREREGETETEKEKRRFNSLLLKKALNNSHFGFLLLAP